MLAGGRSRMCTPSESNRDWERHSYKVVVNPRDGCHYTIHPGYKAVLARDPDAHHDAFVPVPELDVASGSNTQQRRRAATDAMSPTDRRAFEAYFNGLVQTVMELDPAFV